MARISWTSTAVGSSGLSAAQLDGLRFAFARLFDPTQAHEIRALPSGESFLARPGDFEGLREWVEAREAGASKGIYWTLNPVRPDLAGAARVGDVIGRRWVLIDIDSKRPDRDSNATAIEAGATRLAAYRVRDYLRGLSWPDPILIDSGNGTHLLYRVDLPNNEHARVLIRNALKALSARFSDATAEIDLVVHNASRISRLPGTTNRKGPASPERPSRIAGILDCPDEEVGIVSPEMLAAVGEATQEERTAPAPVASKGIDWAPVASDSKGGPKAWAKAALRGCVATIEAAPEGTRNDTLNSQAMRVGGLLWIGAFDEAEARSALLEAALAAGLGRRGAERTIGSGIEAGKLKPCPAPAPLEETSRAKPGPKPKPKASAIDGIEEGERIVIGADEITPRPVEWLWPGRIAIGKLTTFAGWGGLGKSFVSIDLAARVSRGDEIPFGGGQCFEPGNILLVNTEDEPDDTTVPRLIESGADLSRIKFLRSKTLSKLTLDDLATWDLALSQMGGARLIVIDPATAHLGGVDDHKNSGLRAILSPLMMWAGERRVAIILITHLNKPGAGNGKAEALSRVVGGVAWVNAVRGAILFARDPVDRTRALMVPGKNNLGPEAPGLAYRIVRTDGLARVEWLEEVATTADEAVSQERRTSGPDPEAWLIDRFREKRTWGSEEIKAAAVSAGISRNKLWEAKKSLAIPADKETNEEGETRWVWRVPPDWVRFTDGPKG